MNLLIGILLLWTGSSMACSCFSTEARIIRSLSEMQGIEQKDIILTSLRESYHFIYQIPNVVRGALTRDSGVECRLSCSNKGVKVIANVHYKKDDLTCEAILIKPARVESRITLKDIVCN